MKKNTEGTDQEIYIADAILLFGDRYVCQLTGNISCKCCSC